MISETPKTDYSKFKTISPTERINKLATTLHVKRTARKSNSSLLNPESSLNFRSIDDASLPKIQSKKRKYKKGSFLQSWLDEALDSNEAPNAEKADGKVEGMLKTLNKFELDKRYLLSQNIPASVIDKLYNSLYIYTHGINNIFAELLQFIKTSNNHDLLGNFWRAFVKLLEGCTSYQTVFQEVEKRHLQNILQLKHKLEMQGQQFEENKRNYQEQIYKLSKQLEEKQSKFNILANQYKVVQSTLQLTDDAFNEEVNLRLKFEEKINSVYTCYQELKEKYTKIIQQMRIKNQYTLAQENKEHQLKNQLMIERVKIQQLQHMLKLEREKVQERQLEIVIKKQEIEDMKEHYMMKVNKEEQSEMVMEENLNKIKTLKIQLREAENVAKGQKKIIQQVEEFNKKLNKTIQETRNFNNEIYRQYVESGKEVVQLQYELKVDKESIKKLELSINMNENEILKRGKEIDVLKDEKEQLRINLEICEKDLQDHKVTREKNAILLEELKAVKDKYERINDILRDEKKTLENIANDSSSKLSLNEEQMLGIKLLLQTRSKAIHQLEKQIQQQRQTHLVKINALNNQLKKKQSFLLQFEKKVEKNERDIESREGQIKQLKDKITIMESQKIKTEIIMSGKTKSQDDLQSQYNKINEKYKVLAEKFQIQIHERDSIQQKLTSTEYVLKTKNNQEHIQVHHLKNLVQEYQSLLAKKSSFIHPMVHQDMQAEARRAKEQEKKFFDEYSSIKKEKEKLNHEIQDLNLKGMNKQKQKTQILHKKDQQLQKNKESIKKLQCKIQESQKKIQQDTRKYDQVVRKYQEDKEKVSYYEKEVVLLKEKILDLKKTIQEKDHIIIAQNQQIMAFNQRKKQTSSSSRKQLPKKCTVETSTQTEKQEENKATLRKQQYSQKHQDEIEKADFECQVSFQAPQQPQQFQKYEENKQSIIEEPIQAKKQIIPQVKVEKRDFRKALKLTYMRR